MFAVLYEENPSCIVLYGKNLTVSDDDLAIDISNSVSAMKANYSKQ